MFAATTQPQLTCQASWQVPQAHGLRGADAGGLDGGVLAVHDVDVLRVVAAGTPPIPLPGMFVQMMEYFQPVFFS